MAEKRKLKAWVEAMRLRTLPVSIAGVIGGIAVACFYGSFRLLPAAICMVFAVLAQIAANFANEYYDYAAGIDRKGREGFRRGVTEGDITPRAMRNATFATLGAAALLGLTLLFFGSAWLLLAGVVIVLFSMAYSAGPYPLSHHGLGDIAVVIFFGFVPVVLTAYVQMGDAVWTSVAWTVGAGVGLLAANVLIVNNYRDVDDDRAVGKRTTVVMFGRKVMSLVYLVDGLLAMFLFCISLAPGHPFGYLFGILEGVAIGWQFLLYSRLRSSSGAALNGILASTARFLLLVAAVLLVLMIIFRLGI